MTADELRDMRAPLVRVRKRMLVRTVVPLRIARGSESASAHPPRGGLVEPTIDELFTELERRAGQVGQ